MEYADDALAAGGDDSGAAVGERWKWRLADGGVRRGWLTVVAEL